LRESSDAILPTGVPRTPGGCLEHAQMIGSDRLSIGAREAIRRAAEFVDRYGHNQIDTEHLLLALIEQPRSLVPRLLTDLQIEGDALIDRVVLSLQASPRSGLTGSMTDRSNLTVRARQILDQAGIEADMLDDSRILPEHLLLAMFSEQETPAVRILATSGLSRKRILAAMKRLQTRQDPAWD